MFFTGYRFRSIPRTQELKFEFLNLYSSDLTQDSYVGFSGDYPFLFLLNKSGIFDYANHLVCSPTTKPIDLVGYIDSGTYRYSLNGSPFKGRSPKFTTEVSLTEDFKYFLTEDSGLIFLYGDGLPHTGFLDCFVAQGGASGLNCDISVYHPSISYSILLANNFIPKGTVTGIFNNYSDSEIKIFSSNITLYGDGNNLQFLTGNVTGNVAAGQSLNFNLYDTSDIIRDESYSVKLELVSNIGLIRSDWTVNRISGYSEVYYNLSQSSNNLLISNTFSGISGLNSFSYSGQNESLSNFYNYRAYTSNGLDVVKNLSISLTPVSPLENDPYSYSYISGYYLNSSGLFSGECPQLKVTGYHSVTGIDFVKSGILFSSGCQGDIPFTLQSVDGYGIGGSGLIKGMLKKYLGIYDNDWKFLVTGFQILNSGTGYTQLPIIVPLTGVYSNCYDVPTYFDSEQYTFKKFTGIPVLHSLADWATGETICYNTGDSLYRVSGIAITNPGFGYNSSNYIPLNNFYVTSGTITIPASGIFLFNSGISIYNLSGHWSIETGLTQGTLYQTTGYDLTNEIGTLDNSLVIKINYIPKLGSDDCVTKLTLTSEDEQKVEQFLTGRLVYSSDPELLKKKYLSIADVTFPDDAQIDIFYNPEDLIEWVFTE